MTNASGLRSLATVFEQDEAVPYKMLRQADPDGLVIALLRASADELEANAAKESADTERVARAIFEDMFLPGEHHLFEGELRENYLRCARKAIEAMGIGVGADPSRIPASPIIDEQR